MNSSCKSITAVAILAAWLPLAGSALAAESGKPTSKGTPASVSDDDLKAAGERIRETGQKLQADIQEALRKARAQSAALEAKQAAERKNEAEKARQQAARDAVALAATKEAKQRQALEAAQALARKEAEERAAKAEQERLAAVKAQRELEDKLAREQQAAKEKASKASNGKSKLGEETNFGVDI